MESRRLSIRVPEPLISLLESYLAQKELTISEAILATMASYVGDTERLPLVERVSRVGKRLTNGKNSKDT